MSALRATSGTQRYCTGVEVRARDDRQTRTLEADLLVDASGAHSKGKEWLQQLDIGVPEDEVVEGYTGYSSQWFTMASDQPWPSEWWWKVLFVRIATPERPYFIGLFPIENQRWLLSYIGVNKSYPPRGEADFISALEHLGIPAVRQIVRRMVPISPVYSGRATRNRWRHYERWRTPLGRYIALADAACSFNPRFGQGMSAATVSARLLQQCLVKRWGIETTIVVPGAFTKGTNHFAHSGRPADEARVAEYEAGPYKRFGEEVLKAFAAIVPDDAEPSGVADEIVKVVDMPFGKRPFRIHYDPTEDGANVGFTVLDRLRAEMLHRVGLSDLLKPSVLV